MRVSDMEVEGDTLGFEVHRGMAFSPGIGYGQQAEVLRAITPTLGLHDHGLQWKGGARLLV